MKHSTLITPLILCLLFAYSCQEEDNINSLQQTKEHFNTPSIEDAKAFFNTTNRLSNQRTTVASVTDWENSKSKHYKKTDEIDVDILYTPIYLDTQFNAKAFIASTENDGVVDARKLYVLYKTEDISNGLSAYIVVFKLDGTFDKAYNYENGIEVPFPLSNNTSARTGNVDCDDTNVSNMTDEEYEEFLANCYSPLPAVTVTTTIDTGDSPGGGAPFNPFDNSNGWVDIINIPAIDEGPITGPGAPPNNNPQVFVPNTVTANAISIKLALEVDFTSPVAQWLEQQEIANNYEVLEAIAAYLNAHRERPIDPAFDNFGEHQFPTINTDAINNVVGFIDGSISEEFNFIFDEPDDPISDMVNFLECFDTSQPATVTIYANEPNPGSGDSHDSGFVGHSFVSISQGDSTSTFGFYPVEDDIYPIFNEQSDAIMDNDGNEQYSANISVTVTPSQLQAILNAAINFNPTYHLDNYNCTDFAIDIGNLSGLSLPDCYGSWPGGGGSNPGDLGLEIRNLNIINGNPTTAGLAPVSEKGCL
ncbi:MAG: hypothetical protein ED556_09830 [Winogradskyella sp.]|uniref:hypothetical protein n=1 Tax=Winogradskyella sp. TaxID=1883156 RepID=UPI000F404BF3|nr:hypothetical protein [Winogradskyella sp.]RNC84874.1 MAG: hypothetical protein ED556_09830 [Winogradskyella sp.]